jgi:GWxTD domain-containing protein
MDYDGYEGRGLSSLAEATSANPLKLIAPPSVFAAALNSRLLSSLPCLGSIPIPIIMEDALDSVVATLGPVPFEVAGEADYLRGKRLFEAAHDFDPSNERAYRSLAMLYAARNNWEDLAQLARRQTQVTPGNPWTWMTLALATYRTHPGKEVEPMFDTAFARLDQKERDRLDRLERVLRPPDAPRFHLETPESRAGIANTWWMLADPLWSSQHASARTEFLARVTYAELRWSLDAWHVRGADTDRGDIYIRYGPPSKVVGWVDSGADTAFKDAAMHTFWIYDAHLIFAFDKRLHMGTANAFG